MTRTHLALAIAVAGLLVAAGYAGASGTPAATAPAGSVDWQVSAEDRTLANGSVVYDVTLVGNNALDARVTNVLVVVVLQDADGEVVDRQHLFYDEAIDPNRWVDYPDRVAGPFDAETVEAAARVQLAVRHDVEPAD